MVEADYCLASVKGVLYIILRVWTEELLRDCNSSLHTLLFLVLGAEFHVAQADLQLGI